MRLVFASIIDKDQQIIVVFCAKCSHVSEKIELNTMILNRLR